ncbi:MAG: hypothetical protein A2X31_03360 [Elusimicrobia bacterium GWB2_63_22]|nr:MAG: hypothetical protein A2X31_03360 [Elusimicrobia bacterium GWB2_63_22]
MADNSNNRKKTLFVSVLLFLAAGGGVFLFLVIQGSNDLTKGKGNTFTYGSAAREGVASFFKYLGGSSDEEKMSELKTEMAEIREDLVATAQAANPDISDWVAPPSKPSASASPAAVPRMGGGRLSGAGGIGAGGSKSSGGSSRFSEGSGLGNTRISKNTASATGTTEKGTLAALTNARAKLGEGLRSGSAMTAKGKWDSSFGVGGGGAKGDMTYGKSGMVNLDGIKKGEIDNLKVANAKSLKVTEPGEFQRDEKAESKDAGIQAAKAAAETAAKEAAEAAAKKAAAQAALQAASQGVGGTAGNPANAASAPKDDRAGNNANALAQIPEVVQENATTAIFQNQQTDSGTTLQDSAINFTKTADGFEATYTGTATPSGGGKPFTYTQTAIMKPDGTITGWR